MGTNRKDVRVFEYLKAFNSAFVAVQREWKYAGMLVINHDCNRQYKLYTNTAFTQLVVYSAPARVYTDIRCLPCCVIWYIYKLALKFP